VQVEMGPALRAVRQGQGVSLRSVAAAIGVSPSLLSQIETGKTQPSVGTLYALVNHLGVGVDDLLRGVAVPPLPGASTEATRLPTTAPASSVQRASENPRIEMHSGVIWERLCTGSTHGLVEPLLVTYEAGAVSASDGRLTRHAGLEFGVILEGELTLQLDFDEFTLNVGDSVCFESQRPHLYSNRTGAPVRGVWYVLGGGED
jgi:transcriptional regulator with XRE-family HTH domain